MQSVQLYIGSERIELFDDESVVLTQSIQNVKDISKIFTDFTRTFSVPATAKNNKVFKHFYNSTITNTFDARSKVDATIELNHLKFRSGKVKLNGVDLKNNKPSLYKITFFGNTVSLKDTLGEDKLGSLSSLNDYNKIYNAASIKSSLQANPSSNDVIAPLITHTKRLTYNSLITNNDEGNLHYDSSNVHGVTWSDLKYAIRVDKVIQAIANKYGINFSDDFFTSTNEPYYNLFLWLHRKKGETESPTAQEVQSLVNTWTIQSGGFTSTSMISNSTLSVQGTPSNYIKLDLNLKTTSSFTYSVSVQIDGLEVYNSGNVSSDLIITKGNYNVARGNYNVVISSANNITFSEVTWDVGYEVSLPYPVGTIESFKTYTSAAFNHTNSFDFIITQQVPDIKCIDLLTGLFRMFNLTAYVDDDTDQVIVKTLDSYYSGGVSYDVTEFIDTEKSTVNVALPFKEINFEHGDTKTFLANKHSQLFNKTWGKLDYTNGGEKLDGDIYKVKTPFSQMLYERLPDSNNGNMTSVQYGYFVDDNQAPYYGKPLLFYPIRNNGTNISFLSNSATHSLITNYNIPSNSVALSSATSKYNINFNNEINEYTAENDFTDTLFNAYHRDYISDVFDVRNRLTKVSAYLPLRILLNYTLADRFSIFGNRYKINSIKTNFKTGKSDIELLNDIFVVPAPTIPPDQTPPTVPTSLTSSNLTATSFILCWNASTDSGVGVKSYSVFQDGVLIQKVSAVPINFVYCATITGLTSGQSYVMTVSATDFNNNVSNPSTALTVTTIS